MHPVLLFCDGMHQHGVPATPKIVKCRYFVLRPRNIYVYLSCVPAPLFVQKKSAVCIYQTLWPKTQTPTELMAVRNVRGNTVDKCARCKVFLPDIITVSPCYNNWNKNPLYPCDEYTESALARVFCVLQEWRRNHWQCMLDHGIGGIVLKVKCIFNSVVIHLQILF